MSADTPYAFDLETLLGPVPGGRPSGDSLRYEGTYDHIREARREDDPRMSRGIYESEPKRADWPAVESLAAESLSTRTKDLQLAAWLTESWTHLYGLPGARQGLRLMAELCARLSLRVGQREAAGEDKVPRRERAGGGRSPRVLLRRLGVGRAPRKPLE